MTKVKSLYPESSMKKYGKIIYVDNHLLIADKEAHTLTQSDAYSDESLHDFCKNFIKEKFQKKGRAFCEPIHRLDKEASGLVIFARTSKALSRLNQQMREGKINKTYLVKVEGAVEKDQGLLTHFLVKREFYTDVFDHEVTQAKKAELFFETIYSQQTHTLLKVRLYTGRYHQIRAQFSKSGHPIVGDKKYGACQSLKKGIALHHIETSFFHPTTGEFLTFSSEPDKEMFSSDFKRINFSNI